MYEKIYIIYKVIEKDGILMMINILFDKIDIWYNILILYIYEW